MKSLKFFNNLTNAIKTFPIAFVCLVVLTTLSIGETADWFDSFKYLGELAGSTVLVLLLSLYGPLLSLHHQDGGDRKYRIINCGLQILSIIIGGAYFYLLTRLSISNAATSTVIRYLGIFPVASLGIILLISFLLRRAEEDIRIAWANIIKSAAFGTLAGLIVRGGLSGALASIEALFDVDFSYRRYEYFGAFSMIFLTGSFILNYYLISTEASAIILPSRIRKIFGSYIILPLAMIYLAIFIAYGVKILITGDWPKGVIVRLGCGYFSLGMVCYYLTYAERTTFFEIFHRVLFASFLFIVWMMGCAILKRINQYGITINRYLVCMFIIAVAVFSILALRRQRKRLLSLVSVFFIAALISVYGWPINASSVTLFSQKSRLLSFAEEHDIEIPLKANSLTGYTANDARLVAGMIDEIIDNYEIEAWSGKLISTENLTGDMKRYAVRSHIHEMLGLDSYYPIIDNQYFSYRTPKDEQGIDVKGFSKIYEISLYNSKEDVENIFELPEYIGGELDITQYVSDIYEKSKGDNRNDSEDKECYIIEQEGKKYVITSMNGNKKSDGTITINGVYGYLLTK